MTTNNDIEKIKSLFSNLKIKEKYSSKKFNDGKNARSKWAKKITEPVLSIDDFNKQTNDAFQKIANIKLDDDEKRRTTLCVDIYNKKLWNTKKEFIYVLTRNNGIIKIGGTRTGMKERWSSYLCGHCVCERKKKNGESYPGKMSVTNAYLYHTIENDIINNDTNWDIYIWDLPKTTIKTTILNKEIEVVAQTFHAYESCTINLYVEITGNIPQLCNNYDHDYNKK
jgi:hypothetical protein